MEEGTASPAGSQRAAAIVDRHLPDGYSAEPDAIVEGEPAESSLQLQGGDIHRDLYKMVARAKAPKRSQTFSHLTSPRPSIYEESIEPTVEQQLVPGGFRRQYIQRQQLQRRLTDVAAPLTNNFVSFLELYGNFAGEDFADTDDEDDETAIEDGPGAPPSETRPLLGTRRKSSKRIKREGDAGQVKTFFTLLKAFVGTGIMFLPKAFRNGGILFSSITLIAVSLVNTICFHLLLQIRAKYGGGGYGELGGMVFGPRFRSLILGSIALSQLGFVCAGLIFTAENLLSFLQAVVPPGQPQPFGIAALIAIQFIVLIPMALIRNISKLGPAALVADVFIMMGLVYIWSYDISSLSQHGISPSVVLFNPSSFTLTIGSAIFTFEGIGLILPIQSSMKRPEKFNRLLYLIMFIITVIFTSIGALCYATFGELTNIQVISNFPQDSKLVNAIQFLYAIAIVAGEPVQLFPAVRILETSIFGERATGKKSYAIKWKKNGLRSAAMILCGLVAILGASDLDKFVSLIGAFACVPLVYIYPPWLHFKGVAETRAAKAFDIVLMFVGVVAMVYTTTVTLKQWIGEKV